MPEDYFGDDLQGNLGPARIGGRVASQIVGPDLHVHLVREPLHKGSGSRVTGGKEPLVGTGVVSLKMSFQPG